MVEPNTRGRPRSGGALKRVATRFGAMLGVAAVAATGLLTLAPGDAEAASGPWKNGAGYGYAYNPYGNDWEMGGSWAGNFIAGDGSKWACAVDDEGWRPTTNMGSPNYPDATVRTSWEGNALRLDGGTNRNTISGNKLAQAAYVNSHFLDSTSNTTAAAAKIAQYKIFGVYSGSLAETHTTNRLPSGVFSRADEIVAEAQQKAGPYTLTQPEIAVDGDSGQVSGIAGVRGQAGNYLSGFSYTATISGPAEWTSGGKTITGNTSTSALNRNIKVTGNGNVTVTVEVTVPDDRFWVARGSDSSAQDLMTVGKPRKLSEKADPVEVQLSFQPKVTTKVNERYLSAGDPALDTWTTGVVDGQWTILQGEYIGLKTTGHLVGPFDEPQTLIEGGVGKSASDVIPSGANVVGTETHTANGPGNIQAGQDTKVPEPGIYYWVVEIDKSAQTSAHQEYIEESFTDGFAVVEEAVVGKVTPSIATERESEFIDDVEGVVLRDTVELSLADGHQWPVDLDGESGVVNAKAEVYFDQVPHPETPAGESIAGTKVGEASLEFTEVGEQVAEADLTNGGIPGFYTWVWSIEGHDLFDDYTTPAWEVIETSSVRFNEVGHASQTREYNIVQGGRAFDTITIDSIPEYHGDFDGIDGWDGDNMTATVNLYGPVLEAPSTTEVPEGTPVAWSKEVDFKNGTFNVGYDEDDPIILDEPGHYVFVYEYEGDARITPFTSDFDDVLERVYVPGDPEVELPVSVITRATPEVPVGTPFNDEAYVTGNVPEDATLTFELYRAPYDVDEAGKCIIPENQEDAELVATFEGIEVDGPGVYASPEYTAEEAGCYFWVETLFDKDGEEVHKGKFGQPGETTRVYEPEREVDVSTTLKHDGDEEEGPVVGDNIWDEVTVDGDIKDGDYTIVDLFVWDDEENPVCTEPVWTSEVIELVPGETVYETGKYETEDAGVHGFIETTYDADGEIISRGECGDPDETITVIHGGGGDAGAGGEGDQLQSTGANVGVLAGIATVLAALGAGALVRRKVNG